MPSENGWNPARANGATDCEWVRIPGAEHVSLQFLKGWPSIILRAYAADYHAYIEPLRDADSASYTPTNSVATSNHLNGTAMDLNWNSHPFRVDYAGFDGPKIARMRELLAFYNFEGLQIVFWAQDWRTPKDAMHHQLGYGTWNNPTVGRFIAERIRPDGFSTYKRGGTTAPAPSNAVDVLARATGVTPAKAREILPGVVNGLRDSQCNNVNRIAMWLAQIGHESAGFNATEEYASGAAYEGRVQGLGNTQPGDGVRFKGRSWIQITGRHNYTELSKWAHSKGIVPTPTFFVDDSKRLAEIQYAGLGPGWYWTVARPQINSLCDQRNLVAVTQAINGGQNGAADRKRRYDMALAVGNELMVLATAAPTTPAPPTQGDDELSAEAERMIREMYGEWRKEKRGPSRSFLAVDGQGVESPLGFLYNIDGNVWTQQLTWAYLFHVPLAIEVVESVAENGAYTGSWVASEGFNQWLNEFGQAYCQGLVGFKKALVSKLTGDEPQQANVAVVPSTDTRALEDENARLRNEVARLQSAAEVAAEPARTPAPYTPPPTAETLGQRIGRFVDSVDELGLADASDIRERVAIAASIKVLETKNGSEL